MDINEILGESSKPGSLVPTKSAIYVWGYNHSGQTGRKDKERQLRIPKQLPPELFGCPAGNNARWLDIACGREHTAAVASDGSLFTWGANEFGQLGDGSEEGRKYPKRVKQLESEFVKSVACGAHCTAAIAEPRDNDGTISKSRLWVWGQNQVLRFYQCLLFCVKVFHFVKTLGLSFLVITSSCSRGPILRVCFGVPSNLTRPTTGMKHFELMIRQVSCGAVHVVALSEDGMLQSWGYNEYGQLGHGVTCEGLQAARVITAYAKFLDDAPEPVRVTEVSCGEYHSAALCEMGEV
ncbi:unnamed protein product [Linum tenue]|uniref:Uncharacterized protein n=1 Tax=Linum tenue TaxID=586396 RepID=A0AAV0N7A6_9ROSI|nr:unnamed protein product [Linum tenue]